MQTRGALPGCWFAGIWISPRTQKVFKETPSSDPHVGSGGAGEALQELAGSRFYEPVLPILRFFPFVPKSRGVVPLLGTLAVTAQPRVPAAFLPSDGWLSWSKSGVLTTL